MPAMDNHGLQELATADVLDLYDRSGVAAWPDARLIRAVAEVCSVPKVDPADSFVLHTPLELLARAELLRHVAPDARRAARLRLLWLAAQYNEAGAPLRSAPVPADQFASIASASAALLDAIARGELDDVDRASQWLSAHATPDDLRRLLSNAIAPSLAAAAHASILLWLIGRGDGVASLLRGPARELARQPVWKLDWYDDPSLSGNGTVTKLLDGLLSAPELPVPGSTFIYPIMSQVQDRGVASQCLAGVLRADMTLDDVATARRVLSRVAAWSMVQEDDTYVPYGWTHCLTMPQAVLEIAAYGLDPRSAVAIAATHVLGFRCVLGRVRIEPAGAPPVPADGGRAQFADLAANASRHHDAHLVKYTLATAHAAEADPEYGGLYLAAAQRLADYWATQPTDDFLAAEAATAPQPA
jgi:hypothetical protein